MELQVALDRLSVEEAVRVAVAVAPHADWVEVGTSMIKEFGMPAVRRLRAELPGTRLLADSKTNDNAKYEFELCFDAGADAATVMATAPDATLAGCAAVTAERGRTMLIDLLAAPAERQAALLGFDDAVFGVHVSKDVQESGASRSGVAELIPEWASTRRVAVAGGITFADLDALGRRWPRLTVIVGTAITGADDPGAAAKQFADAIHGGDGS